MLGSRPLKTVPQLKGLVALLLDESIPADLPLRHDTVTLNTGISVPSLTGHRSCIYLLADGIKDSRISGVGKLEQALQSAKDIIMIGQPGSGRTRAAYELLSRNWGFFLVARKGGGEQWWVQSAGDMG